MNLTHYMLQIYPKILFELLGLRTTNYLCDNSDIQVPLSENIGKKRGFAYVNVSYGLLKLQGIGL